MTNLRELSQICQIGTRYASSFPFLVIANEVKQSWWWPGGLLRFARNDIHTERLSLATYHCKI